MPWDLSVPHLSRPSCAAGGAGTRDGSWVVLGSCWEWWRMPVGLALGKLRQENKRVPGEPRLHGEILNQTITRPTDTCQNMVWQSVGYSSWMEFACVRPDTVKHALMQHKCPAMLERACAMAGLLFLLLQCLRTLLSLFYSWHLSSVNLLREIHVHLFQGYQGFIKIWKGERHSWI